MPFGLISPQSSLFLKLSGWSVQSSKLKINCQLTLYVIKSTHTNFTVAIFYLKYSICIFLRQIQTEEWIMIIRTNAFFCGLNNFCRNNISSQFNKSFFKKKYIYSYLWFRYGFIIILIRCSWDLQWTITRYLLIQILSHCIPRIPFVLKYIIWNP